jgi:hypothetical protein
MTSEDDINFHLSRDNISIGNIVNLLNVYDPIFIEKWPFGGDVSFGNAINDLKVEPAELFTDKGFSKSVLIDKINDVLLSSVSYIFNHNGLFWAKWQLLELMSLCDEISKLNLHEMSYEEVAAVYFIVSDLFGNFC